MKKNITRKLFGIKNQYNIMKNPSYIFLKKCNLDCTFDLNYCQIRKCNFKEIEHKFFSIKKL